MLGLLEEGCRERKIPTLKLTGQSKDRQGLCDRFEGGEADQYGHKKLGGIGDKVSLPLAPLLAALGFRVPMISGRGLGITGGTLDKLDSIPGFNPRMDPERIVEVVQDIGCVICGQTDDMIPADKKMYALRDATATVPSIPLITASILSKKLAEGLDALILDVKRGSAAFMKTLDDARGLAGSIVDLGNDCGVNTRALVTDMNAPLGRAAGNWLEVKEADECLKCRGPEDLQKLVVECAAQLLVQTGKSSDLAQARLAAETKLADGAAEAKWNEMLAAQGADMDAYADFIDTIVFPSNPHRGLDDSLPPGLPTTSAARGEQLYSQVTIGGTLSCVA